GDAESEESIGGRKPVKPSDVRTTRCPTGTSDRAAGIPGTSGGTGASEGPDSTRNLGPPGVRRAPLPPPGPRGDGPSAPPRRAVAAPPVTPGRGEAGPPCRRGSARRAGGLAPPPRRRRADG